MSACGLHDDQLAVLRRVVPFSIDDAELTDEEHPHEAAAAEHTPEASSLPASTSKAEGTLLHSAKAP